jgi:hypothetical protein
MGAYREVIVIVNDSGEMEMINVTIVKREELDRYVCVTYKARGSVFHRVDCRAQQRIKEPKKTSRRDAIKTMGLIPCRNCEHPARPMEELQ